MLVAVSAGPILGDMTSVVCRSKQYQAGDTILCDVYSADKFGNSVGSIDARDAFSVELADDTDRTLLTSKVIYREEAGSSSSDVKFTMDRVNGEYIVSYTVASIGHAEISAVVGNVKFGPCVTTIQTTRISA